MHKLFDFIAVIIHTTKSHIFKFRFNHCIYVIIVMFLFHIIKVHPIYFCSFEIYKHIKHVMTRNEIFLSAD